MACLNIIWFISFLVIPDIYFWPSREIQAAGHEYYSYYNVTLNILQSSTYGSDMSFSYNLCYYLL